LRPVQDMQKKRESKKRMQLGGIIAIPRRVLIRWTRCRSRADFTEAGPYFEDIVRQFIKLKEIMIQRVWTK
jgi:hypothetical protein